MQAKIPMIPMIKPRISANVSPKSKADEADAKWNVVKIASKK